MTGRLVWRRRPNGNLVALSPSGQIIMIEKVTHAITVFAVHLNGEYITARLYLPDAKAAAKEFG